MANKLPVSDQELTNILTELENDLGAFLSATQGKLSKAREEDGTPSPGMGSASASSPSASSPSAAGSPPVEGSPSASASSPSAGAPPMEGAPASAEGAPPMEGAPAASPAPEGAPEGVPGEGAPAEAALDPAALEAEYSKLPPEELKMHYLAAKAALFAVMGGQSPEAAPSAPAAPPASPAPAAAPSAPPMAMSEEGKVAAVSQKGNGGEGAPAPTAEAGKGVAKMAYAEASPSASSPSASSPSASSPSASVTKSEREISLEAQLTEALKLVNLVVGKPLGKAITNLNYVPKAGEENAEKPMSKAQITQKLNEVTRRADLKKSDRDLINRYCDGEVQVAEIAHLLK